MCNETVDCILCPDTEVIKYQCGRRNCTDDITENPMRRVNRKCGSCNYPTPSNTNSSGSSNSTRSTRSNVSNWSRSS